MNLIIEPISDIDIPGETKTGYKIIFGDGSSLFVYAVVINPPRQELTTNQREPEPGSDEAFELAVNSTAFRVYFQLMKTLREITGNEDL